MALLSLIFLDLKKPKNAKKYAKNINGAVYLWKTIGNSNWLEKRISVVDVLGLVVLPKKLPNLIDLPDDIDGDGNYGEEDEK